MQIKHSILAATLGVFLTLPAHAQDADTPAPPVLQLPPLHNPEPVMRTPPTPPPTVNIAPPRPKTEAQLRAEALFEARQDGFVRNRDVFGLATLGLETVDIVALCAEVRRSYLDLAQTLEGDASSHAQSSLAVFDRHLGSTIAAYEESMTADEWAEKLRRGGQAVSMMTMMGPPAVEEAVNADRAAFESGERNIMMPFMDWLVDECVAEDFAERDAFMAEMKALLAE